MFGLGLTQSPPRASLMMPEKRCLEYSLNDYINDQTTLGQGIAYPLVLPSVNSGLTSGFVIPIAFYLFSEDGFFGNTSQGNYGLLMEMSLQGSIAGTLPGMNVTPTFTPLIIFPSIQGIGTEENTMVRVQAGQDAAHTFGLTAQASGLTTGLSNQRLIFQQGDVTGILTAPFQVSIGFTNTSANTGQVTLNNFNIRMKW